jgi:hypothetical protein
MHKISPEPKVIDNVADQQRLDADPYLDTTFYFDATLHQDRNRNQAGCGSGSATLLKEKEQLNMSGSLSSCSAKRVLLNA